jgi:hypothetical protein
VLNFARFFFNMRCAQIATSPFDAGCTRLGGAPSVELHQLRHAHVCRPRSNKMILLSPCLGFAHPVSVNIFSRLANISSDEECTILATNNIERYFRII